MRRSAEQWLKAVIQVEIRGDGERFLQAAAREGLALRQVQREGELLLAELLAEDSRTLRRVLRLSRCGMRIRRRSGLPFLLAFLRRRPVLPLMSLLLMGALFLFSSLIFRVEVSSLEPLPEADYRRVLALAGENGLCPGRFIWQVDLEHCKRQISLSFPELFFVEVSRRGVNMEIRIAKRIDISPAQLPRSPGDVVAACDGVIENVLVRKGTAAVRSGDTVLKGQVLIYGWQGLEGPVAADGIVTARVWASAYAECPTLHRELQPSGRQQSLLQLRGPAGARLTLFGQEEPYAFNEKQLQSRTFPPWRNTQSTVEIIHGVVGELCCVEQQYSYEEALDIATRDAELSARAQLAASCDISSTSILRSWAEPLQLEEDLARVLVRLEAESQIGQYVEHLWEEDPLPGGLPPEGDW
ncbi:MAG: sporulation protein YqfD [Firmicutes bacterium]|nr:sporulation protein YqfD [Bacillota bacterium]